MTYLFMKKDSKTNLEINHMTDYTKMGQMSV